MIEMLVASALMTLLCGLVFPVFVATARVFEGTLADMELAMQGRALREKMLYRVTDDADSGGLSSLTRTNLVFSSGANGIYSIVHFRPVQGGASSAPHEVILKANNDGTLSANGTADRWLNGHGAKLANDYLFQYVSNSFVRVGLTLGITAASGRTYTKTEMFDAQIVNP